MSNSVLVRIPIAEGGLMLDDQDAWQVGPVDSYGNGLGGLHNISLSGAHPGCLWISLQFCNEVPILQPTTPAPHYPNLILSITPPYSLR